MYNRIIFLFICLFNVHVNGVDVPRQNCYLAPIPCPDILPEPIIREAIGNERTGIPNYAIFWTRDENSECIEHTCS
jgi:hypothetical protein